VGALLASSERHALRLLGGFAVLLGLASVLLCGSRGGGIAMIAELAILFAIIVFCAPVENGRTMILSALAVTALAVGLFAWLDPGSVFKRWQSTASSPEVAAGVRPVMVADSLRMLRRNPVTGVGAGAYEVAYSRYQSWITDVAVDHAHNDYAELLAETGVCGGLLLIAFLAMFFIRMVSGLSERGGAGLIRIGAAIACCGFLLHGFTDFNFHIPANAAWFSAAAGVAVLGIRPSVRPASRTF
jgi:O-antigen ligase